MSCVFRTCTYYRKPIFYLIDLYICAAEIIKSKVYSAKNGEYSGYNKSRIFVRSNTAFFRSIFGFVCRSFL